MEIRVNSTAQGKTLSRAIAESIFRYKGRFVATFSIIVAMVILYTLFAPRQYESEMKISVGMAYPESQRTPESTDRLPAQPDLMVANLTSDVELLRSREVADRVVDPTWDSAKQSSLETETHEKALNVFNRHLSVEPLPKANSIRIIYKAKSPQTATETLRRLLDTFVAKRRKPERSTPGSNLFAAEQQQSKSELDAAREQLAQYQQDRGIISLPAREAVLEQQIIDLEGKLRATEVQVSEYTERLRSGQQELQSVAQRQPTRQTLVPNTVALQELSVILAGYRNQKTALLTKYLPTDRLVQEVDQQIVNTSEAINTASESHLSESITDTNPIWQQIKTVIAQTSIDRSAVMARRNKQASQLASLRTLLLQTEKVTGDYNKLQLKVAGLAEKYQLYTKKEAESQLATARNQQQATEIMVAEPPTFSEVPSSPQLWMTWSLGLVVAFVVALCIVAGSEMGRDTIASRSELEAISSVPVLSIIQFVNTECLPFRGNDLEVMTRSLAADLKASTRKAWTVMWPILGSSCLSRLSFVGQLRICSPGGRLPSERSRGAPEFRLIQSSSP